ncbi:MAG: RCC1 domain-containing protein, partial [Phycisphaerae bacterium]
MSDKSHLLALACTVVLGVSACFASTSRADTVFAWGSNSYGQVGDGTTTDRYSPVLVSTLTHSVTAIA